MANRQSTKLVFLSHITEEKKLAAHIKAAIEDEFSGFVEVFVSSDGISIPAGSNFLKRIEDGLVDCIGAIYLISPNSVKRPWINFELGAVWIRSAISQRSGGEEIPALPFCHSGMTLSGLPAPISSLNAVLANEPSQLKFAFASLQAAVGGKGTLRTNFDALAEKVKSFEIEYTILDRLKEFIALAEISIPAVVSVAVNNPSATVIDFGQIHLTERQYDRILELANSSLSGVVSVEFAGHSTVVADGGSRVGPEARITCNADYIRKLQ